MKNYYLEDQEGSEKNLPAELTIYVNEDEEVAFSCNWEPSDQGIHGISSIFFGLAYSDLADQVFNHLKTQCVLEGNEEDFVKIMELIKSFILSHDEEFGNGGTPDESLVVTPRNIPRL
tara:strand:- start:1617 stop:1970 length:354 start_codon:yes stop_codon:yes gene_type:complete